MLDRSVSEMFLPVIGGTIEHAASRMDVRDAFGTAFGIGGRFYLTAGHVIASALSVGPHIALAQPENQGASWTLFEIERHEVFAPCDVAVIEVPAAPTRPDAAPLHWEWSPLPVLTDVMTFGFAYGLDHQTRILRIRGFKGHTVVGRAFERLPATPFAYELSFQAPRGLSGGPLLLGDGAAIVGMILGNSTTEMVVFSQRERVVEEGRESLVERFEALTLGVAVAARSLSEIEFNMLGGTLRAHLARWGLDGE